MQSRWFVGIGTLALLMLAPAAMAGQGSQGDEDVLLHDIGPGWSPSECPQVEDPIGGASTCFVSDAAGSGYFLWITATPVPSGVDPGGFVEALAANFGREPFETPGLVIAEGRFTREEGQSTIVMAAGDHVFSLSLLSSTPRTDAQLQLLHVARHQQDFAGRPAEVPPTGGGTGEELDRLLLTPPPGSGLEIVKTVDSQPDLSDIRSEARNQGVLDLLNDVPSRTRIFSSGGSQSVLVTMSEEPYDVFAATELGAMADLPPDRLFELDSAAGLPDAVGFRLPAAGGDGLGIAFRKGRYTVLIVIAPAGTDEDLAAKALVELAKLQADLLPDGETAPYFFPSATKSIALTIGLATVICGGALGVGRLSAARGRRRTRRRGQRDEIPSVGSPHVVDVTRASTALRRRGLVLVVVDLAALNVLVVATLAVTGVLRLPVAVTMTLLVVGTLGGIAFTAWWARSELRKTRRHAGALAHEVRPSASGVIGGVVALASLVFGLALMTAGVAGLAFGPSLSGLERSKRFGVDPMLLDVGVLAVGVVLLVLGGLAFRLARTWARVSAERLRARDRRPPILYLRSFEDDASTLPAVVSARRPFLELFAARGADPFEESIAWQVAPYGPVVAIGRPGRSLQSLGAARDHLPDDVWREGVSERMAAARAIVMIIGSTEGLRWEVARLVSSGHLDSTVFVFPPTSADVVRDRWRFTADALATAGAHVPDLPVAPERVLTAVLDGSGVWRVAVADVRDEATFRVGLDQAMVWLTEVAGGRITQP